MLSILSRPQRPTHKDKYVARAVGCILITESYAKMPEVRNIRYLYLASLAAHATVYLVADSRKSIIHKVSGLAIQHSTIIHTLVSKYPPNVAAYALASCCYTSLHGFKSSGNTDSINNFLRAAHSACLDDINVVKKYPDKVEKLTNRIHSYLTRGR